MKSPTSLASLFRRAALSLAIGITTAVGSVALAQPAAAAEWHVVSQSTSCHTYSFGRLCTRKTYSFRAHDSYCQKWNPDPENWYKASLTSISMYQYCYRYSESSYWA